MTKKDAKITPILKWVGGKRGLLSSLIDLMPDSYSTYYEPFLGGGALFFDQRPAKAVVSDSNSELINLYSVVKSNVDSLIESLKQHENTSDYFYEIRAKDRDKDIWDSMTDVERASRMLYLNKTCYNGLYRVNSLGQVNTPFGGYKNPNYCPESDLRLMSSYLNEEDITLLCCDYRKAVETASKGDFVYFDPPYDPISDTAAYTGYTSSGFNKQNQIELCETCKELDSKGVMFMLSNSATEFIKGLYSSFDIQIVKAKRAINCKGDGRGAVDEVIVRNY